MSGITQCPHCKTRFRIHQEQLDARRGLVCCGRCQHAFNARAHLQQVESESPLIAPALDEPAKSPRPSSPDAELASSAKEGVPLEAISTIQPETDSPDSTNSPPLSPELVVTEFSGSVPSGISWREIAGIAVLFCILVTQSVFYFRADIAARLPALQSPLSTLCRIASCTVGLPHQAELLTLEASGLEATTNKPEGMSLTAQIQNRASFTQGFPSLQLTLTNEQDAAVSRRVFRPEDYLNGNKNSSTGLLARQRLDIRLELDITGIKPVGYRLLLFYPQ